MKKNIVLSVTFFLFVILFFNLASAQSQQSLQSQKQFNPVELPQICANCSYNNITSLISPNGTLYLEDVVMTKQGTRYNYTFGGTGEIGKYIVNGVGDPDGTPTVWNYDFDVTASGFDSILGFHILIFGIIYGVAFVGFFGRNEWVSIIGGFMMMGLGVYTILNGIDLYRNTITQSISLFTIGLGAIFSLVPGLEIINDNI